MALLATNNSCIEHARLPLQASVQLAIYPVDNGFEFFT